MARRQRNLPSLPRERVGGVWPEFVVDDHSFMRRAAATADEIERARKRSRWANRRWALRADLATASLKGLLLGLVAFGLWFGLFPAIHLWWVGTGITIPAHGDLAAWRGVLAGLTPTPGDWARALPWLLPICLSILLSVLFGIEAGALLLLLGCVALGVPAIPTHALPFAGFLVAGVVVRCLYELPGPRRPD